MDKDNQIICPVCGTAIPSDAKICPHCKETLWSDEVPEEFGGGSATETSDGTPPPMLGEIYNRDFRPDPDMSRKPNPSGSSKFADGFSSLSL